MADVDLDHNCTLNKKIRNAQLAQYNFILGNLSLYIFFQMLFFFTSIPKGQINMVQLLNTYTKRRVHSVPGLAVPRYSLLFAGRRVIKFHLNPLG